MTSTERGGSVDALGLERTVLVVDADSAIVRLVAKYLARSGFNVLTAGSAEEAIAVAQAHGGRIDLLLAEVMLSPVSGVAVANYLRKRRAGVHVIYTCAYLPNGVQEGLEASGNVILKKPFPVSSLAQKIKEVLEKEG
jgi:DNA-binding response OmpR family regulator